MTRIQLRRDTSANWASNNPVPSAGEPCFEIDTGKLKIGDGSTKYNDLAYQGGGSSGGGAEIDDTTTSTSKVWSSSKTNTEVQAVADEVTSTQSDLTDLKTTVNGNTSDILILKNSVAEKQPKLTAGDNITIDETTNTISATGGSTPTNMVTTDTDQTITGLKNFKPAASASYGVKTGLAVGNMRLGTDTSVSPNPVISGEGIKIVNSAGIKIASFNSSESITLGDSASAMSLNLMANTVNLKAGSSINYMGNLQVGIRTLKYTSATGDTTDLLAGGSGATIDDTATSTDSVWSSSKVNTELGNKQDSLPSTDAGYNININGTSVAGATVYFGGNTSSSLSPHAKADTTNNVLNINGYAVGGSGITMYDTVLKTKSFKYGDRTNQYEVVNKSPDNNTYMAHMAMPSDKYVDLTLGASGTTYTAPADGYFILTGALPSSSDVGHVTLINRLNTTSGTDGKFTVRCYGVGKASVGTGLYASVPAKTGDNIVASWAGEATASILRFIYAVGSEPTA